MTAPLVTILDDEPEIRAMLSEALEEAGFRTMGFGRATEFEAALKSTAPDLCLVDLSLPDRDGLSLVHRLALEQGATVIIISGRAQVQDKVTGLELGADDYIIKPFLMKELFARVRAVLRRIRPGLADDTVSAGSIAIDRAAHRVTRDGEDIHLGPTEFRLLEYLMQHPGRVFSREQLLDAVWGSDVYVEARTVDVHIGRLRKALNKHGDGDPIRTVRAAGYALNAE